MIYAALDVAPTIASFVFSTFLVNAFYTGSGADDVCVGDSCFRGTFLALSAVYVFAALVAVVLDRTNRKYFIHYVGA